MLSVKKDTEAHTYRNELAVHEPQLSLHQLAKQIETDLKNRKIAPSSSSGFKTAGEMLNDKSSVGEKKKTTPNLSTRRGFSLKRSPNHQTSLNSYFSKTLPQTKKTKDHEVSESESDCDGYGEVDKETSDDGKLEEISVGKIKAEISDCVEDDDLSVSAKEEISDADSKYDPEENNEFDQEEVPLSDIEMSEEEYEISKEKCFFKSTLESADSKVIAGLNSDEIKEADNNKQNNSLGKTKPTSLIDKSNGGPSPEDSYYNIKEELEENKSSMEEHSSSCESNNDIEAEAFKDVSESPAYENRHTKCMISIESKSRVDFDKQWADKNVFEGNKKNSDEGIHTWDGKRKRSGSVEAHRKRLSIFEEVDLFTKQMSSSDNEKSISTFEEVQKSDENKLSCEKVNVKNEILDSKSTCAEQSASLKLNEKKYEDCKQNTKSSSVNKRRRESSVKEKHRLKEIDMFSVSDTDSDGVTNKCKKKKLNKYSEGENKRSTKSHDKKLEVNTEILHSSDRLSKEIASKPKKHRDAENFQSKHSKENVSNKGTSKRVIEEFQPQQQETQGTKNKKTFLKQIDMFSVLDCESSDLEDEGSSRKAGERVQKDIILVRDSEDENNELPKSKIKVNQQKFKDLLSDGDSASEDLGKQRRKGITSPSKAVQRRDKDIPKESSKIINLKQIDMFSEIECESDQSEKRGNRKASAQDKGKRGDLNLSYTSCDKDETKKKAHPNKTILENKNEYSLDKHDNRDEHKLKHLKYPKGEKEFGIEEKGSTVFTRAVSNTYKRKVLKEIDMFGDVKCDDSDIEEQLTSDKNIKKNKTVKRHKSSDRKKNDVEENFFGSTSDFGNDGSEVPVTFHEKGKNSNALKKRESVDGEKEDIDIDLFGSTSDFGVDDIRSNRNYDGVTGRIQSLIVENYSNSESHSSSSHKGNSAAVQLKGTPNKSKGGFQRKINSSLQNSEIKKDYQEIDLFAVVDQESEEGSSPECDERSKNGKEFVGEMTSSKSKYDKPTVVQGGIANKTENEEHDRIQNLMRKAAQMRNNFSVNIKNSKSSLHEPIKAVHSDNTEACKTFQKREESPRKSEKHHISPEKLRKDVHRRHDKNARDVFRLDKSHERYQKGSGRSEREQDKCHKEELVFTKDSSHRHQNNRDGNEDVNRWEYKRLHSNMERSHRNRSRSNRDCDRYPRDQNQSLRDVKMIQSDNGPHRERDGSQKGYERLSSDNMSHKDKDKSHKEQEKIYSHDRYHKNKDRLHKDKNKLSPASEKSSGYKAESKRYIKDTGCFGEDVAIHHKFSEKNGKYFKQSHHDSEVFHEHPEAPQHKSGRSPNFVTNDRDRKTLKDFHSESHSVKDHEHTKSSRDISSSQSDTLDKNKTSEDKSSGKGKRIGDKRTRILDDNQSSAQVENMGLQSNKVELFSNDVTAVCKYMGTAEEISVISERKVETSGSKNLMEETKVVSLKQSTKSQQSVDKKQLANWVVKHLMPYYKSNCVTGKDLFKSLARQLAHHVAEQSPVIDEPGAKEYVLQFFTRVKKVTSEADITFN